MSSDEFFALLALSGVVTSIGFAIAWIRTRERAIRAETALAHHRPEKAMGSERIEAAVDAVALEVERLAEGQRFVARLLSERSGVDVARQNAHGRVITPH